MENQQIVTSLIPKNTLDWLYSRGISNELISKHKITYSKKERRIQIPVFDKEGKLLFNKYRMDPFHPFGPKYIYDKGSQAALYNVENIGDSKEIIICEGEFDCLILESYGFTAVTSTGGAGTFRPEWCDALSGRDIYLCFDNDKAGAEAIIRISALIPDAKYVPLPPEVGEHGDITDYFIKLKKTSEDFRGIMNVSVPVKHDPEPEQKKPRKSATKAESDLARAKQIPISHYLKFNSSGYAKCPIHNEKTPSLFYYKERNRWYCYGCGKGGDVVDIVMHLFDLSLPEAIKKLNNES